MLKYIARIKRRNLKTQARFKSISEQRAQGQDEFCYDDRHYFILRARLDAVQLQHEL